MLMQYDLPWFAKNALIVHMVWREVYCEQFAIILFLFFTCEVQTIGANNWPGFVNQKATLSNFLLTLRHSVRLVLQKAYATKIYILWIF